MKNSTPLYVDDIRYYALNSSELNSFDEVSEDLPYNYENNFLLTPENGGIAIKVKIGYFPTFNNGYGVRRKINFKLMEYDSKKILASETRKIRIKRNEMYATFYLLYTFSSYCFTANKIYEVQIIDDSKQILLESGIININALSSEHKEASQEEISETEADSFESDFFEEQFHKFFSAQLSVKDEDSCEEKAEDNFSLPISNSIMESLKDLIGLEEVKEKLSTYEKVVRFNQMRERQGLPPSEAPLHAMFLGSPGTGKTTVAKLMGKMLHDTGILSRGHVVVKERSTLMGQNYGSEEELTLAAINEAQGGILLIDEAYQLYQPKDPRDPGKFVIETLLTSLSDGTKRDWMLILAGYPDEMEEMFKMNPGFKSRIPDSNIYLFEDFSEKELMQIAENYFKNHCFTLSTEAHSALEKRLKFDYLNRGKTFGNARHVINLIETEILKSMAIRVTSQKTLDKSSLTLIHAEDIPEPVTQKQKEAQRSRIGFLI